MKQSINIVVFNVPYPPNYGGIIDVYYLITALKAQGIHTILHCFTYETDRSHFPSEICKEVYYYKRLTGWRSHLSLLPYNVMSRRSDELLHNLAANPWPILFESLHTCYHLNDPRLNDRLTICRMGNVEHDYYRYLAKACRGLVPKLFHLLESRRFYHYQAVLGRARLLLPISLTDAKYFRQLFPHHRLEFVPAFHAHDSVVAEPGQSDFILYHAKLSVHENEQTALFLVHKVFAGLDCPCVIAGMNPTKRLTKAARQYPHIRIEANPTASRMSDLIRQAHIHLLPTFQPTGLKLKLLNSLFEGRHILVNRLMLAGSGLDELCHVADSASDMITTCRQLMLAPFDTAEITRRERILIPFYTSSCQAAKLRDLISEMIV
ncbi:MAG: glycosyltransferase family 1 protein [Tannerellaceae bacterium]|jgi:glycosyltransferase involved in cell wall biosynthesis|nr:glycosyltransferase family 1 protein [Tannerellaceae bacterium]